jgi:alkanesulfonate monooxygenase SsuD/methylene tetrahydromethanopterin reductase-like flavin-dependent oxidoreductase (luciferase family)
VAAGWSDEEMETLGAPFHRRGAVTNEYLRLFRELWTNPEPAFEGTIAKVTGVTFAPRPLQDPLPLWGAGNSPAAVRRAARYCQGWHPRRRTPDELREGVALLRTEAQKAGRQGSLDVAVRVPLTFGKVEGAGLFPLRGTLFDITAVIERYVEAGATHLVLDTFGAAEVGDGSPDEVIETIERFASEVMPRFDK